MPRGLPAGCGDVSADPAPHLLLVGAGHTHLEVLRRAPELRAAGWRVTLLAPERFDYSGMASATAAGDVPADRARVDVAALAARAAVAHHRGRLIALDPAARMAAADDGAALAFDVVSLNLGSTVADRGLEVDASVVRAKPLADLHRLRARLDAGPVAQVSVVGGGATGLELAAHLAAHPAVGSVRLVEAGAEVGTDLPRGARRRLRRLLAARGVEVVTGAALRRVGAEHLHAVDGRTWSHDVALLATGLVAAPLLAELGLGDDDGVPVGPTLQHRDHDHVYAAGDCAHFLPAPLPKVGVHGVRQAPVLVEALLARRSGAPAPTYEPPRRALAVLDLGGGTGLAVRGRVWWSGRSALRLKRRIDARWLARYQALPG